MVRLLLSEGHHLLMAQRIEVQTLCDPCLASGEEVDAEELPLLNLVGNKPRLLALCPTCKIQYDQFVELVKTYGQIVEGDGTERPIAPRRQAGQARSTAGDPPGTHVCPECGRDDFKAPQGLGAHRWAAHGVQSPNKADEVAVG